MSGPKRCLPAAVAAISILLAFPAARAGTDDAIVVTNAAALRALNPEQAAAGRPARLRGLITYAEPQAGIAFIQDETAGVMVSATADICQFLVPGLQAELDGITGRGSFAPTLSVRQASDVRALGKAAFPQPLRLGIEELQQGVYDSQWIELRGVVRVASVMPFNTPSSGSESLRPSLRLLLEISTAQGRYSGIVPWAADEAMPPGLKDAAVRVQGVLGTIVNKRGQWVGLLIYIPSMAHVQIEREAPSDPFRVPLCRVGGLLNFSPKALQDERVRIAGTVLLSSPDYLAFLRTDDGPIEVRGSLPKRLVPGDRVEAAGYPALQNKRVILEDCVLRVTDSGPPMPPLAVSVPQGLESDLHGELVQVQGELVQNTKRLTDLLLILNCDGQSVEATLPVSRLGSDAGRISSLRPGSLLDLTGVAQVLTAMDWGGSVRPLSFRVLLGAPGDIRMIRAPPWWTPARLLWLIAALLAVLGLVAVWVVLLHRQVARQTEIIKEKVQREAIWRDRSRIAQDIHDDLGASLTQVGFLSQRVQASRTQPDEAAALADRIADVARSSVRALDEIVWAVNPRHDSLQSLADYLVKLAGQQFALTPIHCLLDVPAVLPDIVLRPEARHNLALAVKEALHNVVKHSRARTAHLALRCENDRLEISVRDDGIGFRPQAGNGSRNGLANMEARLAEIGGRCHIETGPGQGTRVRFEAPLTPVGDPAPA